MPTRRSCMAGITMFVLAVSLSAARLQAAEEPAPAPPELPTTDDVALRIFYYLVPEPPSEGEVTSEIVIGTKGLGQIFQVKPQKEATTEEIVGLFGRPDNTLTNQTRKFMSRGVVVDLPVDVTGDLLIYGPLTIMVQGGKAKYLWIGPGVLTENIYAPRSHQPPRMTVNVSWKFTEGHSQTNPYRPPPPPHIWLSTIRCTNRDSHAWTVIPDVAVFDVFGNEALGIGTSQAIGLCPNARRDSRIDLTGFYYQHADEGLPGRGTVVVYFHTQHGVQPVAMSFVADWQVNGTQQPWREASLQANDTLLCSWEAKTAVALKTEVRASTDHHIWHLGPLFYDPDDPSSPVYALVAKSKPPQEPNEWESEPAQFLPLTAEVVREQVNDGTRPEAWRSLFVSWLWDQPRPVEGADEIMLDMLNGAATYPIAVRIAAARSLEERCYAPAIPPLLALARNKDANADLRTKIIRGLHLLGSAECTTALADIARDTTDEKDIREAALKSLSNMGDEGWSVIEELEADKDVGDTATSLLKNRPAKP